MPASRNTPAACSRVSSRRRFDADQHVELTFAERTLNLDALDGVNLAVQVAHVHGDVAEVIGEFPGGNGFDIIGGRGEQTS